MQQGLAAAVEWAVLLAGQGQLVEEGLVVVEGLVGKGQEGGRGMAPAAGRGRVGQEAKEGEAHLD